MLRRNEPTPREQILDINKRMSKECQRNVKVKYK